MSDAPKVDELLSIVQQLPRADQVRLARRVLASLPRPGDAGAYRAQPPSSDEFGSDDESLAWEAGGWDGLDAQG